MPPLLPPEAFTTPPRRHPGRSAWLVLVVVLGGAVLLLAERRRRSRVVLEPPPTAAMSSPQARFRSVAADEDSLVSAVRAYGVRARLFDDNRMTCLDLARGLALVDERFLLYAADRAAPVPAELRARVAEVERHYERSGCARP